MTDIKVEALSEIDKIFGLWKRKTDFHQLNHLLTLAKQHIYSCEVIYEMFHIVNCGFEIK